MGLVISCAWSLPRFGSITLRWTDDAGLHTLSGGFSNGRLSHMGSTATLSMVGSGGQSYATGILGSLASFLGPAMDALTAQTVTVTRSAVTGLYTVACTGSTFSLDFSSDGAAGTRMRQLLGFTGDKSGATSYTSDCVPKFSILPRSQGRTAYKGTQQVGSVVRQYKTDAGALGSFGPTYVPRVTSWEHHFEPEGAVWHRMADADTVVGGQQYSWEALAEDAWAPGELCFVEDSVTPTESLAFYLSSSPVGEDLRPIRPEMRRFVVSIDAAVVGVLS